MLFWRGSDTGCLQSDVAKEKLDEIKSESLCDFVRFGPSLEKPQKQDVTGLFLSIINGLRDGIYSKVVFLEVRCWCGEFLWAPRTCSLSCAEWTPNTWPRFPRSKLVLASSMFPGRIDALYTKDTVHQDCQDASCL